MKIGHSNELQALRGIAALCVLVHHTLRVLGPAPVTGWIAEVILNAHAAVVTFFVLSGFVLSKSLLKRGFATEEIAFYYVRRLFRIYPALWAACTVGLFYLMFAQDLASPHFADWAAKHYNQAELGLGTIALSYAAVLPYLNPPLWTILIELTCSALLPFLLILFLRERRLVTPILLLLAFACFAEQHSLKGVLTNFVHFGLGAALALRGTRDIPTGWPIWVALFVMVLFRQLHDWSYTAAIPSLVEGAMATVVIGGIVNGAFKVLSHRFLQWLGDISYSLYLLHLPIAYAIARLLDHYVLSKNLDESGPLMVAVGTLLITLPLAALCYRYIELPAVAVGQRLLIAWELKRSAMQP